MAEALRDFAAAVMDPDWPVPAGLTARPGAGIERRLAVYRNNVAAGLVEALRDGFPVTERIVGEPFFRAMARAFAAQCRPSSPVLLHYGRGLPDFVAAFAPAASVPYLADLAALEAARVQAYHAADGVALGAAALARRLAGRTGDDLLAVRLAGHPAVRIVPSRHPVVSIWVAHQRSDGGRAFDFAWKAETALVTRPADVVRLCALDAGNAAFATALLAGARVGDAGAAALARDEDFEAGSALVALADAGAFGNMTGIEG